MYSTQDRLEQIYQSNKFNMVIPRSCMIRNDKCTRERWHLDLSNHFHPAYWYFVYTFGFGVALKACCHVYHLIWSSQYSYELGRKGIHSVFIISHVPGTVLGTRNRERNKWNVPMLREGDYILEVIIASLQKCGNRSTKNYSLVPS